MSDMIERVAKVLCEIAGEIPDTATPFGSVDFIWQHYIPSARAAIEAMREPTGVMIDSMCGEHQYHQWTRYDLIWQAGIDAALSQDTHSLPLKPQEAVNAGIGAPPPSDAGTPSEAE